MKKFLIIAAMLMAASGASAIGPVDIGIKAGINTGNFQLRNSRLSDNTRAVNDARTGYHAGAFMRLSLLGLGWYIQPEFLYNWNRYDMTVLRGISSSSQDLTHSVSKFRVQTLEVPVLAGIEILFVHVNAGPVFNIMNQTSTSGGIVTNADVMKPSVSFAAGVGIDLMKFSLDVRFNGQLKRTKSLVTIDQDVYDFRSNFQGWTFSLGYKF